jgi:hypothetical protein
MSQWEGIETDIRPEMPYLANAAVAEAYQRQKMGSKTGLARRETVEKVVRLGHAL